MALVDNGNLTYLNDSFNNVTGKLDLEIKEKKINIMNILSYLIASVGIISNFTVVVAFLNHKKLRRKIPNMFIINQVTT